MKLSEQYAETVREQLEQMAGDINKVMLEAKTADKNAELRKIIKQIQEKQKKLEEQLNHLETTEHKNWAELVNVYEGIQHDMEEALSHTKLH